MSYFFILLNGILLLHSSVANETLTAKNENENTKSAANITDVHYSRTEQNNSSENKISTDEIEDIGWEVENNTTPDTRRILYGKKVNKGKRPYMVYLQLTKESAKAHKYRGWLCGGVIVHAYYVLTSAACVEDAEHFYVVSGTTKFVDSFDYKEDYCVCKHRRKVVWKCIPKNYKFDFADSIKWSSNDIAIVKVNKPFKFGVKEERCEFAACPILYNNVSRELEKANTKGFIAGWGTVGNFREGVYKRTSDGKIPENSKQLQEAKVCVMDNEQCAKKWAQRFRQIINQYMICTKDVMKGLSEICDKKYANCTDVETKRRADETIDTESWNIDVGRHLQDPTDYSARRAAKQGGFCENDHGGPLIVKYKRKDHVIGVISACKIDPKSHSCHGPFLYTSVFGNRQFISCAINKDVEQSCRRVFRTGITHEEYNVDWSNIKDDDEDEDRKNSDKNDSSSNEGSIEILRGSRNKNEKEREEKKEVVKEESKSKAPTDKKEELEETKKETGEEKPKHHKEKKRHGKSRKNKKLDKKAEDKSTKEKNLTYESSSDEAVNAPKEE